jgi:hypothetical protein
MLQLYKYPRTRHIEGSGIQRGDDDLSTQSFVELAGKYLVVEEKMDGANCGVSFSDNADLLLQSRGHYLTGGPREAQFHLFKTWANTYLSELWDILTNRYILYGEWLYAKHTMFYTDLPHYFMEFDIYDKERELFLSTEQRQILLAPAPFIVSVKVLYAGQLDSLQALRSFIGHSYFTSNDHLERLRQLSQEKHLDSEQVLKETDSSTDMEGLYVKVEADGMVTERYKYVRSGFLQAIFDSENHWHDRPIIPNQLRAGASLF